MLQKPNHPAFVDLIITNKPSSLQHSCTFETGLPDFHQMALTKLKSSFAK